MRQRSPCLALPAYASIIENSAAVGKCEAQPAPDVRNAWMPTAGVAFNVLTNLRGALYMHRRISIVLKHRARSFELEPTR